MRLSEELSAIGWKEDRNVFEELLVNVFHGEFRNWTDEDLLTNPREALRYCALVRQSSRLSDLADSVVLRALTNLRKAGRRVNPKKAKTKKTRKPR